MVKRTRIISQSPVSGRAENWRITPLFLTTYEFYIVPFDLLFGKNFIREGLYGKIRLRPLPPDGPYLYVTYDDEAVSRVPTPSFLYIWKNEIRHVRRTTKSSPTGQIRPSESIVFSSERKEKHNSILSPPDLTGVRFCTAFPFSSSQRHYRLPLEC